MQLSNFPRSLFESYLEYKCGFDTDYGMKQTEFLQSWLFDGLTNSFKFDLPKDLSVSQAPHDHVPCFFSLLCFSKCPEAKEWDLANCSFASILHFMKVKECICL